VLQGLDPQLLGFHGLFRWVVFVGGDRGNSRRREHIALILLAVVCAHVGGGFSRKGRTDLMKYRGAAIASRSRCWCARRHFVAIVAAARRLIAAGGAIVANESIAGS